VVVGGDVCFARAPEPPARSDHLSWSHGAVRRLLDDADLVVANCEGPITTRDDPVDRDKPFLLRMSPWAAGVMARAGIDAVSLANNHILDHGPQGLRDTLDALDEAGVVAVGAGGDLEAATRGAVFVRRGLAVGLLAFMEDYPAYETRFRAYAGPDRPGVAKLTRRIVRPAIARLRRRVDVLIVAVHWGVDYGEVTGTQRTWARQLAAYGADLVVGHHPHVVRGVGLEGEVPVLYSTGNFAYAGTRMPSDVEEVRRHGWIAEARFEQRRLAKLSIQALRFETDAAGTCRGPAPPPVLTAIVRRVQQDLPDVLEVAGDRVEVRLPVPPRP
jgi:poly-gamma-glutamate synthesis protein (capsule biosynthesis protein)